MEEEKAIIKEPFTLKISERTALRIYPDNRPHCLEISALHKGLIIVYNGYECVEEGAGFGAPIIKYDKTHFPSSAQCFIEKTGNIFAIVKTFKMDAVAKKKVGKKTFLDDSLYRFFRQQFERFYLGKNSTALGFLLNKLMEFRKYVGVETVFVGVESKGKVQVKYEVFDCRIHVEVDFTGLEMVGCREILLLNEQGASFFTKYSDSHGLSLSEEQISGWKLVTAENASLSNQAETLKVTLTNKKPACLFRGREKTKNRFCWSGLSYSLNPPQTKFTYDIQIQESSS
jgi:hypothetical protein